MCAHKVLKSIVVFITMHGIEIKLSSNAYLLFCMNAFSEV